MKPLHLHGPSGVVAPRLRLEDGPQLQGRETAWSQDQQGTITQAGRYKIGVPECCQQQSRRSIGLCGIKRLLNEPSKPRTVVHVGREPGHGLQLCTAALEEVPRKLVRWDAKVVDPGDTIANPKVRGSLQYAVRVDDAGADFRRMLPACRCGDKTEGWHRDLWRRDPREAWDQICACICGWRHPGQAWLQANAYLRGWWHPRHAQLSHAKSRLWRRHERQAP
mmetsp:Transcript_37913/g.120469  ORF Transcript_37913/g.120469 Transcript_37913/m.120469 type:complete len:222 (-) Transcript_37913:1026-1691(-)